MNIRYQFEGPFDSSYSLAILNREMARAVEALRPGSVALYSTEGPGDFAPNLDWLQDDPKTLELWERSQQTSLAPADVTLRNLYPPRVTEMAGKLHVMNTYGWEESVFPADYVEQFNQHLHLVTVMSSFVRKTLIDSGVNVPVAVVGVGVDHILRHPPVQVAIPQEKRFRFLHISSCFPRKGVDVLLDAYTSAFTAQDDVLLLIKTFPNPHNTVAQQIRAVQERKPDCPAIHLINEDMSIGQINSLYAQADALVAPSRGEGFGMPMAEAMLWDVPVITTGYGGHTDFCTTDTAWLVDYRFDHAQTHMGQFDSLWVEPDVLHLMSIMRGLYAQSQTAAGHSAIKAKTQRARETIENGWYWRHVAERLLTAIDSRSDFSPTPPPNLAWVSTWNTRCGIASYSEFLLQPFSLPVVVLANTDSTPTGEDAATVRRCWETTVHKREPPALDSLLHEILTGGYTAVVIQFNFGFFGLEQLRALLQVLQTQGIAVYLFFHATKDLLEDGQLRKSLRQLSPALQGCTRLLVHGVEDVNRLKRFGCVENVTLIPHGVMYAPDILAQHKPDPSVFTIAAYGFLLPGKGIPELIAAFTLVKRRYPQARLALFNALYPVHVSDDEAKKCRALIRASGYAEAIRLHTAYQDNRETLHSLAACDVVVFPYQQTRESSSAAVRMGLASGRPVVCASLGIFGDVEEIVHFLAGVTPEAIAEGLCELIADPDKLLSKQQRQQAWLQSHAWEQVAARLEAMVVQDSWYQYSLAAITV
jgi:glycosyltransferase involved in cell wall biosynthesis